jgi:hypothetical protein
MAAKKTAAKKTAAKKTTARKSTTTRKAAAKKAESTTPAPPPVDALPVEKSGLTSVSHDDLNPAFAIKTNR